jgi:hypothetical protein
MNRVIYRVFYNGEEILDEAASLERAKAFADDWWGEKHQEFRDNKERNGIVTIAAYDVDTDNKVMSFTYSVSDDGYHGDYIEHNTYRGL